MLDALHHAYVDPKQVLQGAFVPEDIDGQPGSKAAWRCAAAAAARGALAQSEAQGGWVLLAPERVFRADNITVEILKRCTGTATLDLIVDDLAKAFAAPRERIYTDVVSLLGSLADKKLLEVN
jgi:pyrroloquinoline quinone biosynthesis protein D